MAALNPYQAPQTVVPMAVAQEQVFEVGPEFYVVARGARLCYAAVLIFLLTIVVFVILGLILGLFTGVLAWALPVIFLICAVLHLVGMLMMSKVDPASRAPGLLITAAVLFGLSFLGGLALVVMQLLEMVVVQTIWVELVQTVVAGTSVILLMIALQRIGTFVQSQHIRGKATSALIGNGLIYGIWIVYIGMLMLAAQGSLPWLAQKQNFHDTKMVVGISVLVLGIYALVSYASAVSMLGKLPQFARAMHKPTGLR